MTGTDSFLSALKNNTFRAVEGKDVASNYVGILHCLHTIFQKLAVLLPSGMPLLIQSGAISLVNWLKI
jgi:hypothetical protein